MLSSGFRERVVGEDGDVRSCANKRVEGEGFEKVTTQSSKGDLL